MNIKTVIIMLLTELHMLPACIFGIKHMQTVIYILMGHIGLLDSVKRVEHIKLMMVLVITVDLHSAQVVIIHLHIPHLIQHISILKGANLPHIIMRL